jgi:hypothetical protein
VTTVAYHFRIQRCRNAEGDANFYVAGAGHVCTACPVHSTNAQGDVLGDAVSSTGCDCDADWYVASAGHVCTVCPAHSTNAQGDVLGDAVSSTGCDCDINYHVASAGHTCTECDPATSTNLQGDPLGDNAAATGCDCIGTEYEYAPHTASTPTVCKPKTCGVNERVADGLCVPCANDPANGGNIATFMTAYAASVYAMGDDSAANKLYSTKCLCPEDYHVLNGVCTAVPDGNINVAGDDPNLAPGGGSQVQPTTGYEPRLCPQNTRVQDYYCVACSITGETNAANDDCTQGNSICDCAPNYFVVASSDLSADGLCTACPLTSTRVQGDNPTAGQPNTYCVCGEDEYIVTNVCTSCPLASTRPQGDDSSGSNTFCYCNADYRFDGTSCESCATETSGAASTRPINPNMPARAQGDHMGAAVTFCYCNEDYVVSAAGVCTACVTGTTSPTRPLSVTSHATLALQGDNAGLGETYCVCGEDEYVDGQFCTTCPLTSTRDQGDDSSGSDTYCFCGDNEHVLSNDCAACPSDSTRPAGVDNNVAPYTSSSTGKRGDDSSGADTGCFCDEHFHVSAPHVCTACVNGENILPTVPVALFGNSALRGDNAIDGNTGCECFADFYVSTLHTCTACPDDSTNLRDDNHNDGNTGCDCMVRVLCNVVGSGGCWRTSVRSNCMLRCEACMRWTQQHAHAS